MPFRLVEEELLKAADDLGLIDRDLVHIVPPDGVRLEGDEVAGFKVVGARHAMERFRAAKPHLFERPKPGQRFVAAASSKKRKSKESKAQIPRASKRQPADYKLLIGWVRFVNGEQDSAPGVGLAFTQRNPSYASTLRGQAAGILRGIAEKSRSIPKAHWLRLQEIELPPRPRRLLIAGNHLTGIKISVREGEAPLDALVSALTRGVERLRLCSGRDGECGKLFVAVNLRGKYCSPTCRQREFYSNNTDAERERKKRAYHDHHARNRQMREARKRGEVWVRLKTAMLH
jgi:hypothetical protein